MKGGNGWKMESRYVDWWEALKGDEWDCLGRYLMEQKNGEYSEDNPEGLDGDDYIPIYNYAYPLGLSSLDENKIVRIAVVDRGKTKIWYPDFTLPEYGVIMEYFGMNGNSSYNDQMAHKMKVYREAGINGIYLTESTLRGPWQERIIERIEQTLEGQLRKIQHHRMDMNSKHSA
jgi:hypothetical protein